MLSNLHWYSAFKRYTVTEFAFCLFKLQRKSSKQPWNLKKFLFNDHRVLIDSSHWEKKPNLEFRVTSSWVGVNCSKFDCSTINWSTLLAGNQLLDTKFINCSNPSNPGSTGFEQLTKKVTNGRHYRAVDSSF